MPAVKPRGRLICCAQPWLSVTMQEHTYPKAPLTLPQISASSSVSCKVAHHRHEISVKTPPRNGPITEAIPNMLVKRPIYRARTLRGTEDAMIARAPEKTPAEPSPATARPKMSMIDPVDKAAIKDPTTQNYQSPNHRNFETPLRILMWSNH